MNVQDEIKALKERIVELEEQAEQEKEFPQFGDENYFEIAKNRVLETDGEEQ